MNQFKKCRIVMLPTEKATKIQRKNDIYPTSGLTKKDIASIPKEGTLTFYKTAFSYENNKYWEGQYLYLLSDEEIKVGDWFISTVRKTIHKSTPLFENNLIDNSWEEREKVEITQSDCKKIISSTDPSLQLPRPSDSFIKKYCELGGIDEVLVEYDVETTYYPRSGRDFQGHERSEHTFTLKVAPDNTLTIQSVKNNWNREELIKFCEKAYYKGREDEHNTAQFVTDGINKCDTAIPRDCFNKWIEENI